MDQIEQSFFRRGSNKRLLTLSHFNLAIAPQQFDFHMAEFENADWRLPAARSAGSDTADNWHVLGDEAILRQRRLATNIGAAHKAISNEKRMRLDFLKRRHKKFSLYRKMRPST